VENKAFLALKQAKCASLVDQVTFSRIHPFEVRRVRHIEEQFEAVVVVIDQVHFAVEILGGESCVRICRSLTRTIASEAEGILIAKAHTI